MSIAKMFDGTNWVVLNGGGSAPTNMVTTDTWQQITGNKEFLNNVTIFDSELNLNAASIIFNNSSFNSIWFDSNRGICFMVDDGTEMYYDSGFYYLGNISAYGKNETPTYSNSSQMNLFASGYEFDIQQSYSPTHLSLGIGGTYSDLRITANDKRSSSPWHASISLWGGYAQSVYGTIFLNGNPGLTGHVHNIHMYYYTTSSTMSKLNIRFSVRSRDSSAITSIDALAAALYDAGHTSTASALPASGVAGSNGNIVTGIYSGGRTSGSTVYVVVSTIAGDATYQYNKSKGTVSISDHKEKTQFGTDY